MEQKSLVGAWVEKLYFASLLAQLRLACGAYSSKARIEKHLKDLQSITENIAD